MRALLRMADANANRAAEALRCLEDLARFCAGDGALASRVRAIRHALRETCREIGAETLAASRDVARDPARPSKNAAPPITRSGAPGIAGAASSRAGEALRALEESLRAVRPTLAERIERIRFDAYDAAAAVTLAVGTGRARQWRVCLLLTESICRRPWRDVLHAALHAGADAVQVREKSLSDGEHLERVRQVIEIARPLGAAVIVNDRADIAIAAEADGVHFGQGDLPIRDGRALAGSILIGASTHDLDEASAAVEAGADYCGVGAMFPSELKRERVPSGPSYLHAFVERFPNVPHLAIGGITPEQIPALVAAGCRGVAVSSAICAASDPGAVVASLRESLQSREQCP